MEIRTLKFGVQATEEELFKLEEKQAQTLPHRGTSLFSLGGWYYPVSNVYGGADFAVWPPTITYFYAPTTNTNAINFFNGAA